MSRAACWFGVVGLAAMLVHYLVVARLLVPLGMAPAAANALGFLAAFQFSYWGHRHRTFRAAHLPHRRTLPRYFLVAGCGFLINETVFLTLLQTTSLDYRAALLLALAAAAAVTFAAGRQFAFRGESGDEKADDLCR